MSKPPTTRAPKPVIYTQPEFENTTLKTLERRISLLEQAHATIERQMRLLRKKEKADEKLAHTSGE